MLYPGHNVVVVLLLVGGVCVGIQFALCAKKKCFAFLGSDSKPETSTRVILYCSQRTAAKAGLVLLILLVLLLSADRRGKLIKTMQQRIKKRIVVPQFHALCYEAIILLLSLN